MTARPVALVTGASSGIGREFARQLAERGHDLVLVARDQARLEGVAEELKRTYAAESDVLVADLSDRLALQAVVDRVSDDARPVDVVVNNAGYAMKGSFLRNDLAVEEQRHDVLVRAVLVLSHAAGRAMRARGRGTIINVSSVAGFLTQGTYSADKAWVTTFTQGLATELASSGVRVAALLPGFTHSELHERAGMRKTGPGFLWLDAGRVVADCLADVDKGRVVSVPSARYKAVVGALGVLPRSLVGGAVRRMQRRR